MDPEFYRNSLQARYTTPDLSSLLSEQAGLTSGLPLGTAFPGASPLASAAARQFGPLPGYTGHALHSNLQESHLQNIATQNAYKSLGQSALGDPYAGLRLTSQQGVAAPTKPLFTQEQKEISYPPVIPQASGLDLNQKPWGLSNFMSQTNPYGPHSELSSMDYALSLSSQPQLNPPPAHSSKPTSNLRHHYPGGADMFPSRSTKTPPLQNIYDHRSQSVTPVSSQPAMFSYSPSINYPPKSEAIVYSSAGGITYEAVSPAAPDHHNPRNESYANVSLEDLASISSTQQKLDVGHQKLDVSQHQKLDIGHQKLDITHQPKLDVHHQKMDVGHNQKLDVGHHQKLDVGHHQKLDVSHHQKLDVGHHQKLDVGHHQKLDGGHHQKYDVGRDHLSKPSPVSQDRSSTKPQPILQKQKPLTQDMYNGQTSQISQVKQSPQPSPMSMGGSPQVQMGSPQASMPSSTVVPAPPPVQAPADSTTKPKKSRSRKKKEPVVEIKSENVRQSYTPQPYSSSSEMSPQRSMTTDYMSSQQSYMQNSRNGQPQSYTSPNMSDAGPSNSPVMTPAMSQSCMKQGNQSQLNFPKTEPGQCAVPPHSNPSAPPQQPPPGIMGFQSPPPATTSQSSLGGYSVSDALEMSREAVFSNQGLLEGYGGSDMSAFGMNESFTSQMGMENMRRQEMYNNQEDGVYVNNPYGGQFVSPNSVLNMDMGNSQNSNEQSTIDEAAFSSLMGDSYGQDSMEKRDKMPYMPLTVKLEAEQDDDLAHLAQTPSDTNPQVHRFFDKPQPVVPPQSCPPVNPKPTVQNASGGTSFMDSFMSFLQGKKPETLSSMSSAIIHNKPQLPKYIPEPRRPRPIQNVDSARQGFGTDGSSAHNSVISFSDEDTEDEDVYAHRSAVQHAMTSLGENEKVKLGTSKTGGLTLKINLTQVKKAEEYARSKNKNTKSKKKRDRVKQFGLKVPGQHGFSSGEEAGEILPSRQQSTRKAKEAIKKFGWSRKTPKSKGKYRESDGSDSDTLKPIRSKLAEDSDEVYDSDNDPAWTPFSLEKKAAPGFEGIEAAAAGRKKSRPRARPHHMKSNFGNMGNKDGRVRKMGEPGAYMAGFPAQKVPRVGEPAVLEVIDSSEEEAAPKPKVNHPPVTNDQVGSFVMEKKDLQNTESYAIWKIEPGRMLHKFELFSENSRIFHRAIPTFSSWLPSMKDSFVQIRVRSVFKQGEKEFVEVEEAFRPKCSIDARLEEKYEEHPLVDAFNVYLQIFLSQALEPGFLSAIRESNERFYLDALDKIDNAITQQLADIETKVAWKVKFKDAVKTRPHIRELDRPNLKQSCAACEYATQPAIKSVHLFGNPYDRFSLRELPMSGMTGSQEFMIGKTAAKFVKPYHNLYHFKYNLYKRCGAKVNITREDNVGDNPAILDQCLQNRAWVLQIFEDLKKLLEKG